MSSKATYWRLFYVWGWKRFFTSFEFWAAATFTGLMGIALFLIPNCKTSTILNGLSTTLISANASILAVALAGLTILVSLTGPEFADFLKRSDLFTRLTFPFYHCAVAWGVNSIGALTAFLVTFMDHPAINYVLVALLYFLVFSFIYALIATVRLYGSAIRFGVSHQEFREVKALVGTEILDSVTAPVRNMREWASTEMTNATQELEEAEKNRNTLEAQAQSIRDMIAEVRRGPGGRNFKHDIFEWEVDLRRTALNIKDVNSQIDQLRKRLSALRKVLGQ